MYPFSVVFLFAWDQILPAFVSPNALNVLVDKFNIMPIKAPQEDLQAILG